MKREITYTNSWTDKDVEAHWDSVASIYVKENEKVKDAHDQRFRESIKHLELFADCRVLNISSRDCEADDYIKSAMPGCNVNNAEISSGLIRIAEGLRPLAYQTKIDSFSALPFNDGSFDRVLSLETLEHVANPIEFLKELYRVSTSDARLVLSCPPATSELPYRLYSLIFGGHGEGPHNFPSSKKVKKMLNFAGWKLLIHKGTVLFPVGPLCLQKFAERIIESCQGSFISEMGIRQFFVCNKS